MIVDYSTAYIAIIAATTSTICIRWLPGSTIAANSFSPSRSRLAPSSSPAFILLQFRSPYDIETSLYPLAVLVLLHRCVAGLTCRTYTPARKTGVCTYLRPRGLNYHRESPYVATLLLNLPNCIGAFFFHRVSRKQTGQPSLNRVRGLLRARS